MNMRTAPQAMVAQGWRHRAAVRVRAELADLRQRGWILLVVAGVLWGLHQICGIAYSAHLSLPYPLWFHTKIAPTSPARGEYVVMEIFLAADHGQVRLQVSDGLPSASDHQDRRALLPAIWSVDGAVGSGEGIPHRG